MITCKVCGSEDSAMYRNGKGMFLCEHCNKSTPKKVSRSEFDAEYWEGKADEIPYSTRRDFWEDYQTSTYGPVRDYKAATTQSDGY